MKNLLIIISLFLLSTPIFGQSERPETIIIPVSGIGHVTNTRKLILENTLTEETLQDSSSREIWTSVGTSVWRVGVWRMFRGHLYYEGSRDVTGWECFSSTGNWRRERHSIEFRLEDIGWEDKRRGVLWRMCNWSIEENDRRVGWEVVLRETCNYSWKTYCW